MCAVYVEICTGLRNVIFMGLEIINIGVFVIGGFLSLEPNNRMIRTCSAHEWNTIFFLIFNHE